MSETERANGWFYSSATRLKSIGATGIEMGTVNLYEVATDTLKTDDTLQVGPNIQLGTGGAINLVERTDPAAPAANSGHVYIRDNGAGLTQLVVRFPTGLVQVIATEPAV